MQVNVDTKCHYKPKKDEWTQEIHISTYQAMHRLKYRCQLPLGRDTS